MEQALIQLESPSGGFGDDLDVRIELRVEAPADVRFEPVTHWIDGHRLAVEDEHRLVIADVDRIDEDVELVPGRYLVRRYELAREIGTLEVIVGSGEVTVRSP